MKVKYTILFETGNEFEPTDYYDEFVEFDEDIDDFELKNILQQRIKYDYPNSTCWLGSYEVYE